MCVCVWGGGGGKGVPPLTLLDLAVTLASCKLLKHRGFLKMGPKNSQYPVTNFKSLKIFFNIPHFSKYPEFLSKDVVIIVTNIQKI